MSLFRTLIVASIILLSVNVADATEWWNASWNYRQKIEIGNTAGNLSYYPVKIELNSSTTGENFNWSNNGDDLRFVDTNGMELDYWIEKWNFVSRKAKIWINTTYLPEYNVTTIFMYYGNSDAKGKSSGKETFVFFDDFEYTDSPENHGWNVYTATYGIVKMQDGWVIIGGSGTGGYGTNGNAMIATEQSFSSNILVEEKVDYVRYEWYPAHWMSIAGSGFSQTVHPSTCYYSQISWPADKEGGENRIYLAEIKNKVTINKWEASKSGVRPAWVRLAYDGSYLRVWFSSDGESWQLKHSKTPTNNFTHGKISLSQASAGDRNNRVKIDYIIARKYVFPEPTVRLGNEEAAPRVYFVPTLSKSKYCKTSDVEIWVNVTNLKGGQIIFTYNPKCTNVTSWVLSEAFTSEPFEEWNSSVEGQELINFISEIPLTGEFLVGTFTIHCKDVNCQCNTTLNFDENSYLFNPAGEVLQVNWANGQFECGCFDRYDVNNNCEISMGELSVAIEDWKEGNLSVSDLFDHMLEPFYSRLS